MITRHASSDPSLDPVSITEIGGKETCFYSTLETGSTVTKTCFSDLKNLDSRTVVVAPARTLARAHQGLESGESVQHIGLRLKQKYTTDNCGFFNTVTANYNMGQEPVCLLTSVEQGGPVSQVCFDRNNPELLTLKTAKGVSLDHIDDQPVSIVIKDPQDLGLRVGPDSSSESEGISLLEALSWWWSQKTPCKEGVVHQEL